MVETENNGTTESMCLQILNRAQSVDSFLCFLQNIPGVVGASIVNNNDFMRDVVEAQFDVKMFHRRGDASGFIARWNNNAKELEGRLLWRRVSHGAEERSSQFGLRCAWLAISSRMDGR